MLYPQGKNRFNGHRYIFSDKINYPCQEPEECNHFSGTTMLQKFISFGKCQKRGEEPSFFLWPEIGSCAFWNGFVVLGAIFHIYLHKQHIVRWYTEKSWMGVCFRVTILISFWKFSKIMCFILLIDTYNQMINYKNLNISSKYKSLLL